LCDFEECYIRTDLCRCLKLGGRKIDGLNFRMVLDGGIILLIAVSSGIWITRVNSNTVAIESMQRDMAIMRTTDARLASIESEVRSLSKAFDKLDDQCVRKPR